MHYRIEVELSHKVYKTTELIHAQLMKTHSGEILTCGRHDTKLTSADDRRDYLCFGDDVCGQLDDSKVPLSDRSLDLVVADLYRRRTAAGSRQLGLSAATFHVNLTTRNNLYAAAISQRCHIPPCNEGR